VSTYPVNFITDREIYDRVLLEAVPKAEKFLWLATSDLKDLHVKRRGKMFPFLAVLSDLINEGVSVRLLHASEPGPRFRKDFDKYPVLTSGLERILCPRVHLKCVVVDGTFAYSGSGNLTGAGMGAKSVDRRNFESGITTTDSGCIEQIMDQFDHIWMGNHCPKCGRKEHCSSFPDMAS
jgi:phosphatidylserine/phosphatidylglycerophosphate/cardiolipin synthase-like enzyme